MADESPQRVRALFDQAADLSPADQRAFLEACCAGDGDLRARLEHLLAYDARLRAKESTPAFLDSPLIRPSQQDTKPGEHFASMEVQSGPTLPPIPGYTIVRELGRGGMGVVFLATQLSLKRLVALKMPPADLGAEDWRRFRTEAEAAARLHHPHVVQVYETGEYQGRPFMIMELLDGGSLAQKLGHGPLAPRPTAELLEILARAVQHAHSRGVVHRDLKPANVLLTEDGTPKVTDFGLARRLDLSQAQTQSGAVLGTPSYMAPEQAAGRGREAGPAADTYALGTILYECLTGRPPFLGATPWETALQVLQQEPVPPRKLQPSVPRDLETICLKCLRKEPAKRYASAEALAADLRRHLEGKPVLARPMGRVERLWRWTRRNPRAAAQIVLVVLALLLAGGAWRWRLRSREAHDQLAVEALSQAVAVQEQAREGDEPANLAKARDLARRAEALLEQGTGRPELAEWTRTLLRQLETEQAKHLVMNFMEQLNGARIHTTQREWDAAATCYGRAFNHTPVDDGEWWFEYAAVQLLSGDRTAYRQTCASLVQRCGHTPLLRPYHMARTCTLAPDSVEDMAAVARLAVEELNNRPKEFWSLTQRAALCYRAGAFKEAVPLLEQSLRIDPRPGSAMLNWLWLALAEQRLGRPEEARNWLGKAANWLDQRKGRFLSGSEDTLGLHLHNWLEAQILRREAEACLGAAQSGE
jgi:serine/threonine protein kinase